jgi:hypothetical protein
MLVDSCVDASGEPVALSYLRQAGIQADAVDLVVATHWHDDHIRGLAKTVATCQRARFVCSAALRSNEFLKLVATAEQETMTRETSGVAELGAVLAALSDRETDVTFVEPNLASADRTLYRSPQGAAVRAVVTALSPSDAAITQALRSFASLLPAAPNPKRRVASLEPNDASVALWVEVGEAKVLLGADLEVTTAADRGWDAVVDSSARPHGLAGLFKIPHHGSSNGHSDRVWDRMVEQSPTTVITRWMLGRRELPTDDDSRRIADRSGMAILLGARRRATTADDNAVARTIRNLSSRMRQLSRGFSGQPPRSRVC